MFSIGSPFFPDLTRAVAPKILGIRITTSGQSGASWPSHCDSHHSPHSWLSPTCLSDFISSPLPSSLGIVSFHKRYSSAWTQISLLGAKLQPVQTRCILGRLLEEPALDCCANNLLWLTLVHLVFTGPPAALCCPLPAVSDIMSGLSRNSAKCLTF